MLLSAIISKSLDTSNSFFNSSNLLYRDTFWLQDLLSSVGKGDSRLAEISVRVFFPTLVYWISFLLSCVSNWITSKSSCQLLRSVSVSRLQSGTVTEPSG